MNIHEQLEKILADLGVEMDYAEREEPDEHAVPEVSIFQSSRDHYGVFYRLDIIDHVPQLRIMVPIENGLLKVEIYLVRFSAQTPFHSLFANISAYHGSSAYEQGREAALQHLLYAAAEVMKQLFWSGELDSMAFPKEIDVQRLL
jgi:hypothetical protein